MKIDVLVTFNFYSKKIMNKNQKFVIWLKYWLKFVYGPIDIKTGKLVTFYLKITKIVNQNQKLSI